jgi:hypothetical protein
MAIPTKLTATQHEEVRAAGKEREFLINRIVENEKQIRKDKRRLTWLTKKQLGLRYGVSPGTISRVLSGEPYRYIKDEQNVA